MPDATLRVKALDTTILGQAYEGARRTPVLLLAVRP